MWVNNKYFPATSNGRHLPAEVTKCKIIHEFKYTVEVI